MALYNIKFKAATAIFLIGSGICNCNICLSQEEYFYNDSTTILLIMKNPVIEYREYFYETGKEVQGKDELFEEQNRPFFHIINIQKIDGNTLDANAFGKDIKIQEEPGFLIYNNCKYLKRPKEEIKNDLNYRKSLYDSLSYAIYENDTVRAKYLLNKNLKINRVIPQSYINCQETHIYGLYYYNITYLDKANLLGKTDMVAFFLRNGAAPYLKSNPQNEKINELVTKWRNIKE